MNYSSESIERIVEYFSSMPTIGKKTALRLVFHLLKQEKEFVKSFAKAMDELVDNVQFCSTCFNFTDTDPCSICSSNKRNSKVICVVEQPSDIAIIESTNEFFGKYHVLHGTLNPLEGIGPEDLKIKELVQRLIDVDEVILALNPNVEGEVTIQYLTKILKSLDVKITRIASGVPIGSSLEFTDQATLSKAFESRVII